MQVRAGDFGDPQLLALLRLHAAGMEAHSPPGHCHYLDLSGLQRPDVRLWTIWEHDMLLGCGAIRTLAPGHGEIKSMRTAPTALRRGVARALLRHLVAVARADGMTRLSLETGTGAAFAPAIALYAAHGFVGAGPFADYEATPFNQFMTLDLSEPVCPPSS
ncbi:GNAT family N-acetyltransferase [Sphingomonas beigongshangi]|uniref:GNAT family N-acetyltransferase n=1 Tax=Sphingomonas beigongshangi TaxID=2782540 RepID=UPI00193C2961|nr:GNAT family N-acetyltransferase [Sphingomonas beigongshangi]